MNDLTSDEDDLFGLEAPYVSLSQLSFSVPVSPSYPKQAIPLSLPSICCSLTINFFFFLAGSPLPLRMVAAFFRFCNSQWWKNMKQGIHKNTLSIWAIWHSDLNGLWSKLTFPELETWKQRKTEKDEYNIGAHAVRGAQNLGGKNIN